MILPLAALGLLLLGPLTPGAPPTFNARSQGGTARAPIPRLSFVLLQQDEELRAGHVSTHLKQKLWRWTVYIQAPKDVLQRVKCVEYVLDRTFPDPIREVCDRGTGAQAFPLKVTAWGPSTVRIRVRFLDGRVQELEHELTF
ncbi:pYEATS domain-containing protein [Vitiosangium sp. GDMCC 1.1324]|uniref:pYEATS domain-containing protein n=1 Tax=Vitiosangium sp. (strain GDMCC 1.1324) TaxID=2138576 RepID=UPI000D37A5B0|nr:pYEATS domain-containing protein [Vitiosangium sp. GDMCC 1.1324]PTL75109.1 hypothetical protein DAT35_56705 [Vitiosangium sp. GDMCC 1.1324]